MGSWAGIVLAIILGGDLVMGQMIEPLTFSHSTGLSPIAVIISTAFWAFMWGPVGLLIATPLTVCLVVGGRHIEALSFMHVLLGDASPLEPAETFYQRALEANQMELVKQARADIARTSRAEYFDHVGLPGLALAQADLSRDALAFDRLEAIHAQIQALLTTLDTPQRDESTAAPPPPEWQTEGAVMCIPGRGQLDDLATTMTVQTFRTEGFGARTVANADLGSVAAANDSLTRLCCICALDGGSSATSIRLFIRRLQRRMPHAAIVVCLWQVTENSSMLATLRSEGSEEFIVLSLGELIALARVTVSRSARSQPLVQGPEVGDQRHAGADHDQG